MDFLQSDWVVCPYPIFDSHFHLIASNDSLIPNQEFLPDPFTVSDYRKETEGINLIGGTVVSASFQGFGQNHLLSALNQLGTKFVGVTQIPSDFNDDKITALKDSRVRGIRFNLRRGTAPDMSQLGFLAHRIHELVGWHTEFYVEAKFLEELWKILISLPAVSIDHLGLTQEGQRTLLKLVEKGIHVKASGFGRCDFDVLKTMKAIHRINPNALMFGTDLPSTRAPRPFQIGDIRLIQDYFDPEDAERIFSKNALNFYRIKKD